MEEEAQQKALYILLILSENGQVCRTECFK